MTELPELRIVAKNHQLIVLDKPSGLLSVPGPANLDCLASRTQAHYPYALVVHRLDCHTSGLMVMALNKDSQRELSRQFHDREVTKRYIAVVSGRMQDDQGLIDLPICADWENRPRQRVDYEQGKPSQTLWQVLERGDDWTRVELTPITGRSHQLRLHLASQGHPILGDSLYADPATLARSARLLLHAEYLELSHPLNRQRLSFQAPCPF